MINIKNTNITLKGGEVVMKFTNNKGGFGERIMVICKQEKDKETLKQLTKAGYFLFGLPTFYNGFGTFFLLNKSLKQKTRNGKQIAISNEMYHINKHIESFSPIKVY